MVKLVNKSDDMKLTIHYFNITTVIVNERKEYSHMITDRDKLQ
ncbi:hypothetical protein Xenpb_03511 [Xenorhabdus sp. PB62.4]|nr:hypothetical protein [Xenorhabdus sp. PB62.4]